MRELKQRFTQRYNKKAKRKGPLWDERFKSVLLENDKTVLLTMAAYIDLNPVRAGLVNDPKDYRWSGYGEAVAGNKATSSTPSATYSPCLQSSRSGASPHDRIKSVIEKSMNMIRKQT
ncbi:MAG: hypothetical protein ACI9DF_001628 [Verrucomicrobiales bacterium]|jgi:hypothetical protein